jgi:A/G-specific adenine glycosylase
MFLIVAGSFTIGTMATPPPPATITALRQHLIAWFAAHARPLPWRQGYHPYQVWISEVMLQQTQMERGVLYYQRWLKRFPGFAEVAQAEEEEVLKLWEGLGYYSRARNLHALTKIVMTDHGGELPNTLNGLLALPGIGKYTARAILSIAYEQDYPVEDGNVERLFARLFAIDEPVKSTLAHERIWDLAEALLPRGEARAWNQALMEFGALVCVRSTPRCALCPMTRECQSYQQGATTRRPVSGPATKTIPLTYWVAVIRDDAGRFLVRQRPAGQRWAKLWEFPSAPLSTGTDPAQAVVDTIAQDTGLAITIDTPLPLVSHSFTKYRATLHPFLCRLHGPLPRETHTSRWLPLADLDALAFSAGHRQVITTLQGGIAG